MFLTMMRKEGEKREREEEFLHSSEGTAHFAAMSNRQ